MIVFSYLSIRHLLRETNCYMKKLCLFVLVTALSACSIFSQGLTWRSIGFGGPRLFAIRSDGTLWASGIAYLGDGSFDQRSIPIQIGTDTTWQKVSSGGVHTVALKSDSTLWAWGDNFAGQIGDGTNTNRYTPVQIGTDKWITVKGGGFFTVGIRSDGTLWGWGRNIGFPGDGSVSQYNYPIQLGNDNQWVYLAAGSGNALMIRKDGTLWDVGGRGIIYGDATYYPHQIGSDNDWVQAHAGDFALALKSNGTLWAWGSNQYGQLGVGSTDVLLPDTLQVGSDNDWKMLGGGIYFGAAVKENGTIWAWGRNDGGQLGDGTTIQRNAPIQVSQAVYPSILSSQGFANYTAYLSADKKSFCFTGLNFGHFGNDKGMYVMGPPEFPVTTFDCENSYCLSYTLPLATTAHATFAGGTGNRTDMQKACQISSSITPNGANPVTGEIKDSVWIEPSVPSTPNGQPYVQRHYGITPQNDASTATATITLYYTQADFAAYNAAPNHGPDLPHDATDAANNKANLRIVKRSGTSNNGTGLYDAYTGSGQVIIPNSVVWDAAINA